MHRLARSLARSRGQDGGGQLDGWKRKCLAWNGLDFIDDDSDEIQVVCDWRRGGEHEGRW